MTYFPPHRRRPATGFTLVEILIAVSIIVLMIGLALPAFRTITGSRSTEGATNTIAAMLARARTDAVGLQITRGVGFYTDATGQCRMAEVGPVQFPAWGGAAVSYPICSYVTFTTTGATGTTEYYISTIAIQANSANQSPNLDTTRWHKFVDNTSVTPKVYDRTFASTGQFYDQLPDSDAVSLPLGVSAQTIADGGAPLATNPRKADGYLHVGVIAFDSSGRLMQCPTIMSQFGTLGKVVGLGYNVAINNQSPPVGVPSSFGLVVYDRDAHDTQFKTPYDPAFDPSATSSSYTTGTPSPSDEESWLDANATPLLINRYTGTLVRGE